MWRIVVALRTMFSTSNECSRVSSSSGDQASFLSSGAKLLCQRSRHCQSLR